MKNKNNTKSFAKLFPSLFVKGFCMGAADVVPGVSGGTMALILGIYRELIVSIRSFDLEFFRLLFSLEIKKAFDRAAWRFVLPLLTGILTAVFTLAGILSWLLDNRPVPLWSFFFGLILASIFTLIQHFKKRSLWILLCIILGAFCTYYLVGIMPAVTPDKAWFLFLCGAMAICAMILPGISGAFILVLLGKYHFILEAVHRRDFLILLSVAAGAGAGIFTFASILNWFFKKYPNVTIAVLTGFMLGSLRKIWPWKKTVFSAVDSHENLAGTLQKNILPEHWNVDVMMAICISIAGFLLVFLLNFWAKKRE
jgi:putative membrane protein